MKVRLELHLDLDDERQFVWWASSPEVAGFYAAADHLHQLISQAETALAELVGQDVEIQPFMAPDEYTTGDAEQPPTGARALARTAA